jgi:type I restriction enzyme M protein
MHCPTCLTVDSIAPKPMFQIWEAPDSIQQKIKNKVEASHQKREQSKQLLEIAKTGVERAIETDEATATIWINEQLKTSAVELI